MIDIENFTPIDDLLELGWKGTHEQLAAKVKLPLNVVQSIVSQHTVGDNGCWKIKNGIVSHRTPKKIKQISAYWMFNG